MSQGLTRGFEFPHPYAPVARDSSSPMSNEWTRYLAGVARDVDSLKRRVAVLDDSVVGVYLTGPQLAEFFGADGIGVAGKAYDGWAIADGQGGRIDRRTEFGALNLTPLVCVGG